MTLWTSVQWISQNGSMENSKQIQSTEWVLMYSRSKGHKALRGEASQEVKSFQWGQWQIRDGRLHLKERVGKWVQCCWIIIIINTYVVYCMRTAPVTLHRKTQSLQQKLYEISTVVLYHRFTDQETKLSEHCVLRHTWLICGRGRIWNPSILAAKSCLFITIPYCLSNFLKEAVHLYEIYYFLNVGN